MVGKNDTQIISTTIQVELETVEQIKKLFGNLKPGGILKLCDDNVELKLISADDSLAFDGGVIVEFILSYSDDLAIGVVGSAVYEVIRNNIKKLQIGNRRTRTNEEDLIQALEKLKEYAFKNKKPNRDNSAKKKSRKKKKKN